MKKYLISIILIFVMYQSVFCQEKNRRFTIQTSPGMLFIDLMYLRFKDAPFYELFIMDLEYQYKINNTINVSLAMSVYSSSPYSRWGSNKEFNMNFTPMFIYRPLKTGLKGFYISLYPIIGWRSFENDDDLYAELGLGITTGYKWIFKNGFSLQLGTGISKRFSIPRMPWFYYDDLIRSDGSYPFPVFDMKIIDFKIGYSF